MQPTPENLEQLDHSTLMAMRQMYEGNQEMQNLISQYEHQAFTRESTAENPLMAIPYAVAIPGYNVYKQMTGAGRSEPSMGQVVQGYKGIYQGLMQRLKTTSPLVNQFKDRLLKSAGSIIPEANAGEGMPALTQNKNSNNTKGWSPSTTRGTLPFAPPTGSEAWREEHEARRIEALPWEEASKLYGDYGKGNINLNNRPVYVYPDEANRGSYSSLESTTVNFDGKEVLIPKIINGKLVGVEEAIKHYKKTGEHLGVFDTPAEAQKYAIGLERRQQSYYEKGPGKKILDSSFKNIK